jgi:hypothetical protein
MATTPRYRLLERSVQFAVVLMGLSGTAVLGMGQFNPWLPLLALVLAPLALWLCDGRGWRLNAVGGTIAALLAFAAALSDFWLKSREAQLISLANLLAYLQFVLWFRQKNSQVYWMLMVLGFLQLCVAAVINHSLLFGVLMVVFLIATLTALPLFLVWRERQRIAAASPSRTSSAAAPPPGLRLWHSAQPRLRPRGAELPPASREMHGILRHVLASLAAMAVLVPITFALVPRTHAGRGSWYVGNPTPVTVSGFGDSTVLGSFGLSVTDPTQVLNIEFLRFDVDPLRREPYPLNCDPLLRGAVRHEYRDGAWYTLVSTGYRTELTASAWLNPAMLEREELVVQRMTVKALSDAPAGRSAGSTARAGFHLRRPAALSLFSVYPIVAVEDDPEVEYDLYSGDLVRRDAALGKEMLLSLVTNGFRNGQQCRFTLDPYPMLDSRVRNVLLQLPPRLLSPEAQRDSLQAQAQRVVADIPPQDVVARCLALEAYLRDSGLFQYSTRPIVRDEALDPVEDFVMHNRQGHCEFFASALALMLRSVGIPSRLVLGYRCAEYNEQRGQYIVRQSNAHAWVEAFVPYEALPRSERPPPGPVSADLSQYLRRSDRTPWRARVGAWMRLDPTPAVGQARIEESSLWVQVREYLSFAWSAYVLGLEPRVQREAIYTPLLRLIDAEGWKAFFSQLLDWITGKEVNFSWFNWRVWVVAFVVQLLLIGGLLAARRAWRRRRRSEQQRAATRASAAEVQFYRRLEHLLAQHHFFRQRSQTHREFAQAVGGQLADQPATQPVAVMPRRLTESFYRVRFGHQHLDASELATVEQCLQRLESALQAAGNGTPQSSVSPSGQQAPSPPADGPA